MGTIVITVALLGLAFAVGTLFKFSDIAYDIKRLYGFITEDINERTQMKKRLNAIEAKLKKLGEE